MNILIVKLGATGDVVRTTPLLRRLSGNIVWLTSAKNTVLLETLTDNLRCFSWQQRELARAINYDLVINLEDTLDVGQYVRTVQSKRILGAYIDVDNQVRYTDDSRGWFDLSLVSVYGRKEADWLKLQNRHTYQELIFECLGYDFEGEKYLLPEPVETDLSGDVAIAREAGPVWPMKNWAYYDQLKEALENRGLTVNVLPVRPTLREHLCDVRNHRCLVGGDSLPMHLALGTGTRCVSLFTCTSPWEIYDYGIQEKIVSPRLNEFFYQRGFDSRATMAISVQEVLRAVTAQLELTAQPSTLLV